MDGNRNKKDKVIHGTDMTAWQRQLIVAIERFAAVQQDHLQKLASGKLKDVMSWRHRRQHAFALLKQDLDMLANNFKTNGDPDFLKAVQDKMQSVLEAEQALNSAACAQKEKLANQLSALRKGRKAVQRYRFQGPGQRPKFLSNRT